MIIRKATIKDLKSIQELNLLLFKKEISDFKDVTLDEDWVFSEKGTEYFTKKILEDENIAEVAEDDGKIVGYLVGGMDKDKNTRKPEKVANIENTLVLEKYRGKGIGGKLMDTFIDWCNSKNIERICVCASALNEAGIGFYKKHGFKEYEITLDRKLV